MLKPTIWMVYVLSRRGVEIANPKWVFILVLSIKTSLFSSPELKARGKLKGWDSSTFKLEYLLLAGQAKINFICGGMLHLVLCRIGLELWFPWQHKTLIGSV